MMTEKIFKTSIVLVAVLFTVIFFILVTPPLIENPDIVAAFAAGFVNPYSSGYSTDVICCWVILCLWIVYERPQVKYGWICLMLGIIPGVAVGFAAYLFIRTNQLKDSPNFESRT